MLPGNVDCESQELAEQERVTPDEIVKHNSANSSKQDEEDTMKRRLSDAKKMGRRRRFFISTPTTILGALFVFGGAALVIFDERYGVGYAFGYMFSGNGVVCWLLSLLPTDRRAVPCLTFAFSIAFFLAAIELAVNTSSQIEGVLADSCFIIHSDRIFPCWFVYLFFAIHAVMGFVCLVQGILFLVPLYRRQPSPTMLRFDWLAIGIYYLIDGIANVMVTIGALAVPTDLAQGSSAFVVKDIFIVWACLSPSFALKVQHWLGSRGEASTAAAGVAQLLAGRDVEQVLQQARSTFRYVLASKVSREDLADSKPNPALMAYTEKAMVGEVDAFISHSWHDEPDAKWDGLQLWRKEFVEQHDREPKLWIDKYCIDQNDIEESLACLPVYLAGCKNLVIFFGATYLQRLWCLVEIFTFLEMGVQETSLNVRILQDRTAVLQRIEAFDPQASRCFDPKETLRLKTVLDAGDHGSAGIKRLVQTVFLEACTK
eukprot:TRINITY_DN5705_c0_g1_i11.p1 TRINITY_DN5705_c0_g1~~TRINITY_DN5705_c0_g1_i11.p1  ORF type:complete len:501 (-),score=55.24 TRINITY_DN5705_c0_g1_i11:178-1635(-)